jgi:anti-anti-sigma factor
MSPPAADRIPDLALIRDIGATQGAICAGGANQLLEIIEHTQPDGSALLALVGELDIAGVDRLRQRLARLEQTRTATILDLSALTFTDCAGLGVLTTAQARARRDPAWTLKFAPQISPQVRRLINVVAGKRADDATVTALVAPVARDRGALSATRAG